MPAVKTKINVYFWFGDNDFDMYQDLDIWKKRFIAKYSNLNSLEITGTDTNNPEAYTMLNQALKGDSLFGNTKLIILKNILSGGKEDRLSALINEMITVVPANTFLLIFQTEPIKQKDTLELLTKLSKKNQLRAKEFKLPTSAELLSWGKKYTDQQDIAISPDVLKILIEKTEITSMSGWNKNNTANLWLLAGELDKLIAYNYPAKTISPESVNKLIKKEAGYQIWTLINTLTDGDFKKSLFLLEQRLTSLPLSAQTPELRMILGLWAKQIKKLLLIKTAFSETELEETAKQAKWTNGQLYILKKQAKNLSLKQLLCCQKKLIRFFKLSTTEPKTLKAEFFISLLRNS